MRFSDVQELHQQVNADLELILAHCSEVELENFSWEDLLELAKDRDDEAAEIFTADMEANSLDLEAELNGQA